MTLTRASYRIVPALLVLTLLMPGCFKFVPDYDSTLEANIIQTAKMVDIFYRKMEKLPEGQRPYSQFKDGYFEIETELNSLYLRQKTKPLNGNSIRITEIAIELFTGDRATHEKTGTFKTVLIKRHNEQMQRVFIAMANAEAAKKLVNK